MKPFNLRFNIALYSLWVGLAIKREIYDGLTLHTFKLCLVPCLVISWSLITEVINE